MKRPPRRVGLVLIAGLAVLAISIPVLAASPTPAASPQAAATPAPASTPSKSEKPDKVAKPDKGAETAVTLKGILQKVTDAEGRPSFTMAVDGKTWTISAGPPWFWGDKNPLAAFVGKSVTVAGTTRAGEAEVDVETVNGTALRGPGKPPWAGGPWAVGKAHPGWKDWMVGGKPGHGQGPESAPGQAKKASPTP